MVASLVRPAALWDFIAFSNSTTAWSKSPCCLSNRAYKDWPTIFNNDATLTSAMLDRLLHHAETVVIEGKSYRMKEKVDI